MISEYQINPLTLYELYRELPYGLCVISGVTLGSVCYIWSYPMVCVLYLKLPYGLCVITGVTLWSMSYIGAYIWS